MFLQAMNRDCGGKGGGAGVENMGKEIRLVPASITCMTSKGKREGAKETGEEIRRRLTYRIFWGGVPIYSASCVIMEGVAGERR